MRGVVLIGLTAALSMAGCAAALSWADGPVALAPGTRVRVTAPGGGARMSGAVLSTSLQELVLDVPDRGVVTLEPANVSKLEISRGHKSLSGHLAFFGVLAVPVVGCALTRPCIGSGTFVLGALSGATGALIGRRFKYELWEELPVGRARVTAGAAAHHGLTAYVRVGF